MPWLKPVTYRVLPPRDMIAVGAAVEAVGEAGYRSRARIAGLTEQFWTMRQLEKKKSMMMQLLMRLAECMVQPWLAEW